jgi:hypothetical protein
MDAPTVDVEPGGSVPAGSAATAGVDIVAAMARPETAKENGTSLFASRLMDPPGGVCAARYV